MAINNIWRSNPTRMMGLSSGMDTDFLVQQSMRVHQMRIDSRMRQRTILEWRQATHTSIREQVTDFRNTFLRNLSPQSMVRPGMYNTTVANVISGNAGAVTVGGLRAGAPTGTIRISGLSQVAKGANITSASKVSQGGSGFKMSDRLGDIRFAGGGQIAFSEELQTTFVDKNGNRVTVEKSAVEDIDWESINTSDTTIRVGDTDVKLVKQADGSITFSYEDEDGEPVTGNVNFTGAELNFKVGDEEVTLRQDDDGKIERVVFTPRVDKDGEPVLDEDGYQIIDETKTALTFTKRAEIQVEDINGDVVNLELTMRGDDGPIQHNGRTLSYAHEAQININGVDVTLTSTMTVEQMMNRINGSGTGATISYDALSDRFSIESNTKGASSTLAFSGQMFELFGFERDATSGQYAINAGVPTAAGATVTVNGKEVAFDLNDNVITLGGGVTITLNGTSNEDIVIEIKRDASEAMDRIKSFVDAYNSLISRIEGLLRERKTSSEASYMPLTEEEKSVMTENQIAQWEDIARKGIMRGDSSLQSLERSLRSTLTTQFGSAGLRPSDIGIATGPRSGGTGGQIVLDEDRLRAALEENPEAVADMFGDFDSGFMGTINNIMGEFISPRGTQSETIRSLENSIRRANEQMEKMQLRMWAEEDRLYRQFAAMETALSNMQQQGDWFSAMLGGVR